MSNRNFETVIDDIPPLPTQNCALIQATLDDARFSSSLVKISGPPGVGKTHSCSHFAAANPHHVFVVNVTPVNAAKRPFLVSLAESIGAASTFHSAAEIFKSILYRLSQPFFNGGVLIILDEAQNLKLDTLATIMAIYNATAVPFAFVGNHHVLTATHGHVPALDQITDRISLRHTVNIPGLHADDIRLFAMHFGVERADAYQYLSAYGANKSLRRLCGLLREARLVAGPRGSIRLPHLREAVATLHGEDEDRGLFKLIPKPQQEENAA